MSEFGERAKRISEMFKEADDNKKKVSEIFDGDILMTLKTINKINMEKKKNKENEKDDR